MEDITSGPTLERGIWNCCNPCIIHSFFPLSTDPMAVWWTECPLKSKMSSERRGANHQRKLSAAQRKDTWRRLRAMHTSQYSGCDVPLSVPFCIPAPLWHSIVDQISGPSGYLPSALRIRWASRNLKSTCKQGFLSPLPKEEPGQTGPAGWSQENDTWHNKVWPSRSFVWRPTKINMVTQPRAT